MTSLRAMDHPTARSAPARRTWWPWIRLFGGAAVLAVVLWRLGAGPFLDGLRSIDPTALALAAGIGLMTTVCCSWRWSLVARGLGVGLPMRTAVAAYYWSQFLNTMLPGGVLGDVHRAVRHGRDVDNVGRSLRAVAWERCAGLAAFIGLTLLVLLVLPSPVQSFVPAVTVVLGVFAAVAVGAVRVVRARTCDRSTRWARLLGAASDDIRDVLLARSVWPKVLLASGVVVAGHTATFLIAVRTAGSTASPGRLLPVAVLVLLAMVVPLGIGGWGPREGMAAWAFGAAGLGAAQGVAAATVYGVLTLVAALPGAAVPIAGFVRPRTSRVDVSPVLVPDAASTKDADRG